MNVTDSSKICRLCLVEAEVMCSIFNSYSKNNLMSVSLPQRIMSFASIKVDENDGLPSSICYQCLAQVDKSYQFKLQCEESDAALRYSLQEQLESDSETGDWEMMKFTPEVIINEGEDDRQAVNERQENDRCESDSENSVNHGKASYPLSEVQELLRHHGTEIRLQAVNGSKAQKALEEQNGRLDHSVVNGNGHTMDYYSLYDTQAILNNHPDTGSSFSAASSDMNGVALPPLIAPQVNMGDTTLSALLQRKGELGPELSFLSPNGFQKSRRSRDGQKLFQCRLCPKSYSFSSALSRHKAVHNTELRPYVCNMCRKGFSDFEKLERHMRTHISDPLYPCDICGRVFKALATFERHKILTQGQCRLFTCMMCGLGFSNKTKLKLHPCKMPIFDRRFPCHECNEEFDSRENFEAHVIIHSGVSEQSVN